MYTSCGWFFDEISGIETVQVLRYAARVLQLARLLDGDAGWEAELVRRLVVAPSNVPGFGDGAGVWRRRVAPSVTDLARVAAHYAMARPSEGYGDSTDVHAFRIERLRWARVTSGAASLAIGRVRVTAQLTTEREEVDVAVLHAADGEIHCRVRAGSAADALPTAQDALFRDFPAPGPPGWPRALERHFGGRSYTPDDVFPDERRRLLTHLAERALEGGEGDRQRIEGARRRLLDELRSTEGPIPSALVGPTRELLERAARDDLAMLATGGSLMGAVSRVRELLATARSLGIALDLGPDRVTRSIASALDRTLGALRASPTAAIVTDALALLELGEELEAPPDLWMAQNVVARLWREATAPGREALAPLMAALGFAPHAVAAPRGRG